MHVDELQREQTRESWKGILIANGIVVAVALTARPPLYLLITAMCLLNIAGYRFVILPRSKHAQLSTMAYLGLVHGRALSWGAYLFSGALLFVSMGFRQGYIGRLQLVGLIALTLCGALWGIRKAVSQWRSWSDVQQSATAATPLAADFQIRYAALFAIVPCLWAAAAHFLGDAIIVSVLAAACAGLGGAVVGYLGTKHFRIRSLCPRDADDL